MSTTSATSERNNDLLWGAIGILGVLAISYLYVGPQMVQLKDARAASQAREQDNQDIELQITEVAQLIQQLDSQQDALAKLALAAPVGSASDQLLVALQAITSESGVSLLSVQPNSTDNLQSSSAVTMRGSYTGVHLFFELLQKNIRPLLASNVAITSTTDVVGASLLNVSLTITAAQVVPTVDTPIDEVQL